MTKEEIEKLTRAISYKNWRIRFVESQNGQGFRIIAHVPTKLSEDQYYEHAKDTTIIVQWGSFASDFFNGYSEREFLNTLMKMIKNFEMHEAEEWFKFNGEPVFHPHEYPAGAEQWQYLLSIP